jgi:hypothetical protein
VPAKAVPPVGAEYHCILVPVAAKSATVGLLIAQNGCVEEPVGAAGIAFIVTTALPCGPQQPAADCALK